MFIDGLSKKPDKELVRLLQQGSERALTELYARYSKKLVRYFHRMLWRDEAKAQDFLHDLFVKVIESPDRIDADSSFSTWLYSVAHNMCKNEYRRNEVRRAMKPEWVNGKDADYIRQDLDYRTLQGELEKLLVQANEDDRSLFIMRYEVELTLPEIAAIIEIPQGTVKSRLHYLKKRLSERLQAFNPAIN